MEQIILKSNDRTWTKPAAGQLAYILHKDEDDSWRVVCLKAGYPTDNETIRSILESALSKVVE